MQWNINNQLIKNEYEINTWTSLVKKVTMKHQWTLTRINRSVLWMIKLPDTPKRKVWFRYHLNSDLYTSERLTPWTFISFTCLRFQSSGKQTFHCDIDVDRINLQSYLNGYLELVWPYKENSLIWWMWPFLDNIALPEKKSSE